MTVPNLSTKMNSPQNNPKKPNTLKIQSNLPPNRSIEAALKRAKILGADFKVAFTGPGYWDVEIVSGDLEAVREALKKTLGLKVIDQ